MNKLCSELSGWRRALAQSISTETLSPPSDRPSPPAGQHWAQLSTIRAGSASGGGDALAGRPSCRTVNLRTLSSSAIESTAVSDNMIFGFISDTRSSKLADVKECPFVELMLFFPSTMTQFRCSGKVHVVGGGPEWEGGNPDDIADAAARWKMLSARERRFFAWPPPGANRDHCVGSKDDLSVFDVEAPGSDVRPHNFVFCRLQPDFVEVLDLKVFPHVRQFYDRAEEQTSGWRCREVNP